MVDMTILRGCLGYGGPAVSYWEETLKLIILRHFQVTRAQRYGHPASVTLAREDKERERILRDCCFSVTGVAYVDNSLPYQQSFRQQ